MLSEKMSSSVPLVVFARLAVKRLKKFLSAEGSCIK
jgi:hypothetical protein